MKQQISEHPGLTITNVMHPEQALGIAATFAVYHCPLIRQERGTLRKEHTEGASSGILPAVPRVLSRALVR